MKIVIELRMEQTKPTINATNIEAILTWIKTNIMDKLPADASATFTLRLES